MIQTKATVTRMVKARKAFFSVPNASFMILLGGMPLQVQIALQCIPAGPLKLSDRYSFSCRTSGLLRPPAFDYQRRFHAGAVSPETSAGVPSQSKWVAQRQRISDLRNPVANNFGQNLTVSGYVTRQWNGALVVGTPRQSGCRNIQPRQTGGSRYRAGMNDYEVAFPARSGHQSAKFQCPLRGCPRSWAGR